MKFIEIYQKILPLWGERIEFDDAIMVESKMSYKSPWAIIKSSQSFYSKKLNDSWNKVEEKVKDAGVFEKQMVWVFYQLFQKMAQNNSEKNIHSFSTLEIKKELVENEFFALLSEPGFEEELANYERILE